MLISTKSCTYYNRNKLSCETQLLEFVDDIATNMDTRTQTDVLIMDFSKAFDKVGHKTLTQVRPIWHQRQTQQLD